MEKQQAILLQPEQQKKDKKKFWIIIGIGFASLIAVVFAAVVAWFLKESNEYDDKVYPVYGVFMSTQALSAYSIGGRNSAIVRMLRKTITYFASLGLSAASLVVGVYIYATRKIKRR